MNRTQSSLALALVLVFASGIAVGGFGYHLYTAKTVTATSGPSPDKFRKDFVADMKVKLGMTDDQVGKMNAVLDQTRLQYKEVRDRMKPDMNRIKSEQIEKINSFLSPEQQKSYQQLRAERDEKAKQRSGGGN
jgi:hypothetical protein